MKQLTISEIDHKIAIFEEGLTKSFVPAEEKQLYRDGIAALKKQKASMSVEPAPTRQQQQVSTSANGFQTQHQGDTESQPGDDKKKSLSHLLVVWQDLHFVKQVRGLLGRLRILLGKTRFRL